MRQHRSGWRTKWVRSTFKKMEIKEDREARWAWKRCYYPGPGYWLDEDHWVHSRSWKTYRRTQYRPRKIA